MDRGQDARERVLIGYGEVMCVVQYWELALAGTWWLRTRKRNTRPTGDFDTARSQKEIMRLEAAFLRTPAQSIREAVSPHLERETATDLQDLMAERNRLAHRFLRDHADGDQGAFKPGTHGELIALGDRFLGSLESVMQSMMGSESYAGPVLDHWPDLADRIVERVFSGKPIPKDPSDQ